MEELGARGPDTRDSSTNGPPCDIRPYLRPRTRKHTLRTLNAISTVMMMLLLCANLQMTVQTDCGCAARAMRQKRTLHLQLFFASVPTLVSPLRHPRRQASHRLVFPVARHLRRKRSMPAARTSRRRVALTHLLLVQVNVSQCSRFPAH